MTAWKDRLFNINLKIIKIMYFVAKLYTHVNPSIVEKFDNKEHAIQYAKVMTESGKGAYVVLEPIQEYTPPTPILK